MRSLLLAAGFAAFSMLGLVTSASAETCDQRGNICLQRAQDPAIRKQCKAPERMAACRQTGVYTAPSGRSWPAQVETGGARGKKG